MKKRKKNADNDNEKTQKKLKKDQSTSISPENCFPNKEKKDFESVINKMENPELQNKFKIDYKTLLGSMLKAEKVEKNDEINSNEKNFVQVPLSPPRGIISSSVDKNRTYVENRCEENSDDVVSQYDNCNRSNAKNVPQGKMNADTTSSRQKDLFEKMKELILPRIYLAFRRFIEINCKRESEVEEEGKGEDTLHNLRDRNTVFRSDCDDNSNSSYNNSNNNTNYNNTNDKNKNNNNDNDNDNSTNTNYNDTNGHQDNNHNNYNDNCKYNDIKVDNVININVNTNRSRSVKRNLNYYNFPTKENKNKNQFEIIEASSQNSVENNYCTTYTINFLKFLKNEKNMSHGKLSFCIDLEFSVFELLGNENDFSSLHLSVRNVPTKNILFSNVEVTEKSTQYQNRIFSESEDNGLRGKTELKIFYDILQSEILRNNRR